MFDLLDAADTIFFVYNFYADEGSYIMIVKTNVLFLVKMFTDRCL